ncbi:hypothetical protein RIF29_18909 [Crotalaria pallida]|uniref:AAA+ ATPase At3g28540-like C-terminal domain-containing protein n=1 Tax=Crotalaria pallida TaxID=3830 RepID=A0AAN9EYF5_CROPI
MGSAIDEDDDHVLRMKKGKGLKRMRETFIDDAVDGEWVPGESSSSSKTKKKQKKSAHPQAVVEAEPSVLPQEFMDRINEMGGTEITLVFFKVLYPTDLTKQANRLLMPLRKIKNAGFLREGELQELKAKMEVPLIQPSLELTKLTLTLWDMSKENGTANYYYALITNWKKVVDANQLKEGDLVQLLRKTEILLQGIKDELDIVFYLGSYEPFEVLAMNYIDIDSHSLFGRIGNLLEEVKMTPADVAENLMPKSVQGKVLGFCKDRLEIKLERNKTAWKVMAFCSIFCCGNDYVRYKFDILYLLRLSGNCADLF